MGLREFLHTTQSLPNTPRMPSLFVGHGSPMNGIEDTIFSKAWENLGNTLPRPTAILAISAHWCTEGTYVHIGKNPKTIYDFYGFPPELYAATYPCKGTPSIAHATKALIETTQIHTDTNWGIDHGTWIVLRRMYPQHDIPVFQLSIDIEKPMQFHYDLGRELAALRTKGVLIMGTGNIVHNLGRINFNPEAEPFDWATRFDAQVRSCIENSDHTSLINYEQLGEDALLSIPYPDHYIPLLYTLGTQHEHDTTTFPVEGMTLGSISMRSVLLS